MSEQLILEIEAGLELDNADPARKVFDRNGDRLSGHSYEIAVAIMVANALVSLESDTLGSVSWSKRNKGPSTGDCATWPAADESP